MQLSFFDLLFPRRRQKDAAGENPAVPQPNVPNPPVPIAPLPTPPASVPGAPSESNSPALEPPSRLVAPRPAGALSARQLQVRPGEPVQAQEVDLHQLWCEIRATWFAHRPDIDRYTVRWSGRSQKRTLASCNIEKHRVTVARELQHQEYHRWLEPLLYHEMCHAYLGMSVFSATERSRWHGPEFKRLERRHPQMIAFDLWVQQGGWAKAVRSDRARRARRRMLSR